MAEATLGAEFLRHRMAQSNCVSGRPSVKPFSETEVLLLNLAH